MNIVITLNFKLESLIHFNIIFLNACVILLKKLKYLKIWWGLIISIEFIIGLLRYLHFLRFIDNKYPDDSFMKCINHLAELLDQDCERDLFLFTVKINNINNNSTSNEVVDPEKLFYIFKNKNEFVKYDSIIKFDYNEDGIISINDLKNTILKYYDVHFFDNKKILEENDLKNRIFFSLFHEFGIFN